MTTESAPAAPALLAAGPITAEQVPAAREQLRSERIANRVTDTEFFAHQERLAKVEAGEQVEASKLYLTPEEQFQRQRDEHMKAPAPEQYGSFLIHRELREALYAQTVNLCSRAVRLLGLCSRGFRGFRFQSAGLRFGAVVSPRVMPDFCDQQRDTRDKAEPDPRSILGCKLAEPDSVEGRKRQKQQGGCDNCNGRVDSGREAQILRERPEIWHLDLLAYVLPNFIDGCNSAKAVRHAQSATAEMSAR